MPRRDPRIDAFRGAALLMIIVTHIPGNPWEGWTIREAGFSDAAEAFFLISGIATGIAYTPAVDRWRQGSGTLWGAVRPMWARAWTLYLTQILLTVVVIGLYAWAADAFYDLRFQVWHNLGLVYSDTGAALAGLPTLGYQIGYVNILPTYILLMLAAPAVIALGQRAPWATLGTAGALWFVAGTWSINVPNHPGGGGWFLAPASWQLVFVLGVLIGIRHRAGTRLVPANRYAVWTTIAFLAFVFAWRNIPELAAYMNHRMAELYALGAPSLFVSHDKTFLGLPRLLHVLALAYALSSLPIVRRAAAHGLARPLRILGQQGLLVFALGTVLAHASQILKAVEPDAALLPWLLPPLVALVCFGAAWARSTLREAIKGPGEAVSETSPMRRARTAERP